MPETYGLLQLPIPVPSAAETPADPLLDVLLDFCRAVINARGGASWKAIVPQMASEPIKTTLAHNPALDGISAAWLPALFIQRTRVGPSTWLAQDYWVRDSTLTLWWVPPRLQSMEMRGRVRAWGSNALHSILDAIVDPEARNPAWVVPQDTDPVAQQRGSLIWRYLNVWELETLDAQWVDIKLRASTEGMPPFTPDMVFPALQLTIYVRERNEGSPANEYDELGGLDGLEQQDTLTVNTVSFDASADILTETGAALLTETGEEIITETEGPAP